MDRIKPHPPVVIDSRCISSIYDHSNEFCRDVPDVNVVLLSRFLRYEQSPRMENPYTSCYCTVYIWLAPCVWVCGTPVIYLQGLWLELPGLGVVNVLFCALYRMTLLKRKWLRTRQNSRSNAGDDWFIWFTLCLISSVVRNKGATMFPSDTRVVLPLNTTVVFRERQVWHSTAQIGVSIFNLCCNWNPWFWPCCTSVKHGYDYDIMGRYLVSITETVSRFSNIKSQVHVARLGEMRCT
jgi:hypothetical protein